MSKKKLEVGQKVWVKTTGNRARGGSRIFESIITKVGRKYFEVDNPKWTNFSIATMLENSNYTPGYKIYLSKQEILDENEIRELDNYLSRKFGRYGTSGLSLESLRNIKKIIENEQKDKQENI